MNAILKHINHLTRVQKLAFLLFVIIALLHGVIANDKYLIAKDRTGIKVLSVTNELEWGINTIIPYSATYLDHNNRSVSPFSNQKVEHWYKRHWLGTDSLGRDVLAGIIYGSYVALQVGFGTMVLSLFVGLFLSFLSGYYGDSEMRVSLAYLFALIPLTILSIFYVVYGSITIALAVSIGILLFWRYAIYQSYGKPTTIGIPFDMIIFRVIDVLHSIPGLFLILILLSLFEQNSLWNVVLVIVFLRWPVITRHLRAEILKIKEEDYISSMKSLGQSHIKVFWYHILPQAISPVIIVSAFGFATAILMESTLSFLGIGTNFDEVTWGSLIKQARNSFSDWWLAVFPGLAIYLVIVLFNSIGESLSKRLKSSHS